MAAVSLVPGQLFAGDFVIERELSEGGMGVVYVARQQSTGKPRALKVMQPQLVSSKDPAQAAKNQQRFLAEARAGGAIQSEHVVEVVTAGIDASTGAPWMAMELLDGNDLDVELTRRERMPFGELLTVFEQLGHALGEAHRAGVFHLDLKPENIFLARSHSARGGTTVKVLDFGIARMVSEQRRSTTVTTAIGSPFWMSPEQSMRGAKVGAYTDVWALGLIAFRALTGRHYWREANVPRDEVSVTGWLMEMMTGALDPASVRASEYGAGALLPDGFDAWFSRCVTRDVNARFPSASECITALTGRGPTSDAPNVSTAAHAQVAPTQQRAAAPPAAPPQTPLRTQLAERPLPPVGLTARMPGASEQPGTTETPPSSLAMGAGALGLLVVVGAVAWLTLASLKVDGSASTSPPTPSAPQPTPPSVPPPSLPAAPAARCPSDMALIPAGEFMMGSPDGQGEWDERPQHRVRFAQPFCLDRTEVSVAAYGAFGAATQGPQPGADRYCTWGHSDLADHPINCVDWTQARSFCAWAGHEGGARRLPREAEWEYAARGSAGREYPWGDEEPDGARTNLCGVECVQFFLAHGDRGWSGQQGWRDAFGGTAPVTALAAGATPEGLLNMAGNVSEWVEDVYEPGDRQRFDENGLYVTTIDPQALNTSRIARGGSWINDVSARARAADRNGGTPSNRDIGRGFRCARAVL